MSEFGYVEQPVIEWLSGKPSATPSDPGLGWTYRDEAGMAEFNRPLADPLVEALLVPAIRRINPFLANDDQATGAVNALRAAMQHPDRLTANRESLKLLQNGATMLVAPGEHAKTVQYVAFEPDRQHLNDFTATNQYKVQGAKGTREDTVLLVNGIPLVVAEYKSYLASGHDWREAVRQLHRYQQQAPLLLAPNVFCIAADEFEFRFGTILFHDATKEDVERHLDTWGRWLSLYPEQKGYWNTPAADNPDDSLEVAVRGMLRLRPCHVLDYLRHFWVFETKKNKTAKKIARYQQFEAVNDMVDRVFDTIGTSVDPQQRTGLIWHTQGSGKSLSMIFAGAKLRAHPALSSPTVLIVVDRRDLKTQLSDDFDACDYDNVAKALGVQDLKAKLRGGWRGTLVTTLQSFQRMNDLTPVARDNVICLIDEAHRSQSAAEGTESPAMTMRVKLPNAYRFGFTGTPIDRTMVNTHREFGPIIDGQQERYLSYYGIKRAINDGATLPVHYILDKVPFDVDEQPLSASFEQMCEEAELDDQEAKTLIQQRKARWKELAQLPERIDIVLDKLLAHFLEHPDPNGFKAQLVAVDRSACAAYKDALDAKIRARGLPPEWSDVIISEGQNDEENLRRFHYGKTRQDTLIEWFKRTPSEWDQANRELYGEDRSRWRPPLKILIVCDRLITGFDAPVEAVMYLDRPMRDHNLLQAIARTNRPLPAMGKETGVVVDYFGVLADLERALNFDENVREEALIDWDALRATVPAEVARCMEPFQGITIEDTRACLLAALRRLSDPETAHTFETNFNSLGRLWEAVSPDPCLYPHRYTYHWLCGIYVAYRRRQRGPQATYGELSAKTRQLIEENTRFIEIAESLPVYRIDENTMTALDNLPTAADKAAALEAALTAELAEQGGIFTYHLLGERLQKLKKRRDTADAAAAARLKELADIAAEAARVKSASERLELDPATEYRLYTVLKATSTSTDEGYLASCARRMIAQLRAAKVLTPGWSQSRGARMRAEQSLLVESWNPEYAPLGYDPNAEDPPFLKPAIEELAQADG
jgi:type I restriction enzyme R subunit